MVTWFERKFDYLHNSKYHAVNHRTIGWHSYPRALKDGKIRPFNNPLQLNGKWSILEQIGHLVILNLVVRQTG
jgi:hypothetical protein